MTPEQARRVYEAMSDDQREALAEWVQKLGRLLRDVEPAITAWQERGIDEAERYANQERP